MSAPLLMAWSAWWTRSGQGPARQAQTIFLTPAADARREAGASRRLSWRRSPSQAPARSLVASFLLVATFKAAPLRVPTLLYTRLTNPSMPQTRRMHRACHCRAIHCGPSPRPSRCPAFARPAHAHSPTHHALGCLTGQNFAVAEPSRADKACYIYTAQLRLNALA